MKFSNHLWQKIIPLYKAILSLPFNIELANGTLSQERFHFYMQQDSYYLIEFSKTLALIASRSRSSSMVNHFLKFSLGALIAERELHAHFLKSEIHDCNPIEPSPACMGYTRYLMATAASASLEEAMAAVLPCFWIYREVGRNIEKNAQKNNPYALWISTYASQEFSDVVDQAIGIIDDLANQCSPNMLMLMTEAFEYCTLFEWHFWNDAYQMAIFQESYRQISHY